MGREPLLVRALFLWLLRAYMKRSMDVMHLAWVLERIDDSARRNVLSEENLREANSRKQVDSEKEGLCQCLGGLIKRFWHLLTYV